MVSHPPAFLLLSLLSFAATVQPRHLANPKTLLHNLTLVGSDFYPNGQPCQWGTDLRLAAELAVAHVNTQQRLHLALSPVLEASGVVTPQLLSGISNSLASGSSAVLGLAWSNVAAAVVSNVSFPPGSAALGVASSVALEHTVAAPQFIRPSYCDGNAAATLVSLAKELGWKTVALIGTPANAFGAGGIEGVKAGLRSIPGAPRLSTFQPFAVGATQKELTSPLLAAAKTKPDGWIISAPGPDTRAVFQAAAALGLAPGNSSAAATAAGRRRARAQGRREPIRWLATEKVELGTPDVLARAGAAGYACYGPPPANGSFLAAFRAAYSRDPDPWAAYAYSEVLLVADALLRATPVASRGAERSDDGGGTQRRLDILSALRVSDLETPLGRLRFPPGSNSPERSTIGIFQLVGNATAYNQTFDLLETSTVVNDDESL